MAGERGNFCTLDMLIPVREVHRHFSVCVCAHMYSRDLDTIRALRRSNANKCEMDHLQTVAKLLLLNRGENISYSWHSSSACSEDLSLSIQMFPKFLLMHTECTFMIIFLWPYHSGYTRAWAPRHPGKQLNIFAA